MGVLLCGSEDGAWSPPSVSLLLAEVNLCSLSRLILFRDIARGLCGFLLVKVMVNMVGFYFKVEKSPIYDDFTRTFQQKQTEGQKKGKYEQTCALSVD